MTEIDKLVDATIVNQDLTKAAMTPLALALIGAGVGGVGGGISAFRNPKNRTRGRSLLARTLGGAGLGALAGGALLGGGKALYDSKAGQAAAGEIKEQVDAAGGAVKQQAEALKAKHLARQAELAAVEEQAREALGGDTTYEPIDTRRVAGTSKTLSTGMLDLATGGTGLALGGATAMRMQRNPARGGTAIPKFLLDSSIPGLSWMSFGQPHGFNPEVLRQELSHAMSLPEGSTYRTELAKQLAALGLAPETRLAAGVSIPADPNAKAPPPPPPRRHGKRRPPPPPPPPPPKTPDQVAADMVRLGDSTVTELASRIRAQQAVNPNVTADAARKMFSEQVLELRRSDARIKGMLLTPAQEQGIRAAADHVWRQKILEPTVADWRSRTGPKGNVVGRNLTRPATAVAAIPLALMAGGRLFAPATQETSYAVDPATLQPVR